MAEIVLEKKVTLSQIAEDLKNGLTKWKKDDIGFGSLEKKYNLQNNEMITLLAHPKIKVLESRIPTFIIVDDLEETQTPVLTANIEVGEDDTIKRPKYETKVIVQTTEVKEKRKSEAFI